MKICLIVGTRPEIIKVSPLVKILEKNNIEFFIIHSNQHYSPEMDKVFFEELNLPNPKYNLNVGSGKHSNQTGNILIKVEPILEDEKPDYVLVQGDTNTVLAGAMAAAKLNIKVGHIEAGLRSYDRKMPEETNRVVTDHLSSFLFAVTKKQEKILKDESIDSSKITIVGNTVVDAVFNNIKIAEKKSNVLQINNLSSKEYVLLTAHRSSNVDSKTAFNELIDAVSNLPSSENIIWPIHPRAKKQLNAFKIGLPKNIRLINPTGYLDFLVLQKNAKIVLTDSGGLQEECCILGTPCITLRENTERPETIDVGSNRLVGRSKKLLKKAYGEVINIQDKTWENPFGDGTASQQILNIISEDFYGIDKNSINYGQSVSVIGLGYMGLPMACLLANAGHNVTGVDINIKKVEDINKNLCPFDEKDLPELLNRALSKKFKASITAQKSDIFLISVPTPHKNSKCDLSYVYAAIDSIIHLLEDDNLIIIESTIRPNTCTEVQAYIKTKTDKKVLIAHCPERAIPGSTIQELIYNDRIIGGLDSEATDKAFELYKSFSKGTLLKTNATTAECCKLLENTYRDVNIALANEFDIILKDLNVNPAEAISLANRHPRVNILQPGPGVGGHCIAIDPWFLIENTDKSKLIPMARKINDERPNYWVKHISNYCKKNKFDKIALLGVAYKKNVDDTRESPSKNIFEGLVKEGFKVKASDPNVKVWDYSLSNFDDLKEWADVFVITTGHDIFKNLELNNDKLINTCGL